MDEEIVVNLNDLIDELNASTIKEGNHHCGSYDDGYDDDNYVDWACCGPWSH